MAMGIEELEKKHVYQQTKPVKEVATLNIIPSASPHGSPIIVGNLKGFWRLWWGLFKFFILKPFTNYPGYVALYNTDGEGYNLVLDNSNHKHSPAFYFDWEVEKEIHHREDSYNGLFNEVPSRPKPGNGNTVLKLKTQD